MAVLGGALHTTSNKGVGPVAGGNFPGAAYLMTMAVSGTAQTVSWRQWYNNGASKAAIYSADGTTLLGETDSRTTPSTGTRTGTIAVPFSVTASTQYYIVILTNNDNDSVCIQTNNDGTDVLTDVPFAAYTFTAPVSPVFDGGNLGVPGITVDGTAGTADTITVDSGSLALEGQSINLVATDALTIAVTAGQMALEGQEIPFILAQPGADGALALEGQDVSLLAEALIDVTAGQYALEGQDVGLLGSISMTVEAGALALDARVVDLVATGIAASGDGGMLYRRRRRG